MQGGGQGLEHIAAGLARGDLGVGGEDRDEGEQILRAMGSLQDVRDMSGNCDGILADTRDYP